MQNHVGFLTVVVLGTAVSVMASAGTPGIQEQVVGTVVAVQRTVTIDEASCEGQINHAQSALASSYPCIARLAADDRDPAILGSGSYQPGSAPGETPNYTWTRVNDVCTTTFFVWNSGYSIGVRSSGEGDLRRDVAANCLREAFTQLPTREYKFQVYRVAPAPAVAR